MQRPLRRVLVAILVTFDAQQAPPAMAAWPHDPLVNLAVGTAAGGQTAPAIISDGAGGAIIAWMDVRDGLQYDICAQHVLASGVVDPAWPAGGCNVSNSVLTEVDPRIVPDGGGGAIIAWSDNTNEVRVQRVLASGVVDPAWPAGGRAVAAIGSIKWRHDLISDGAGGAFVTWRDGRNGNDDIYATHVRPTGALDPAWPAAGVAVCAAPGSQDFPRIASDGAGGAFVAWVDLSVFDDRNILVHRVLASGALDPQWPADGRAVCAAAGNQQEVDVIADGWGGVILAWQDLRNGGARIYSQRVLSSGATRWAANGKEVAMSGTLQYSGRLVTDGAGGAIVTWHEYNGSHQDVRAQHLPSGTGTDTSWSPMGLAVCGLAGDQMWARAVPDGSGGAIVAWTDRRNGQDDIYAHHVMAYGNNDPLWPLGGRAVCSEGGYQDSQVLVADGDGGVVIAWRDFRRDNEADIFAQRVAPFGRLGTPEPVIAGVEDVPNDQGGQVKVSWSASYLDTGNDPDLAAYDLYRSVPPNVAAAMLARGRRALGSLASGSSPDAGTLFTTTVGATTYYWEFVRSQQPLHILPGYSVVTPTTGDSTGAYNPSTAFMVVARSLSPTPWWMSKPASGYSVDNLPPLAPDALAGSTAEGTTYLHWEPNAEADLASYRVYRGTSATFVPGPENLVSSPPDTGWADVGTIGWHYKVSAVDIHGNESGFALLSPVPTTDAPGGGVAGRLSLSRPSPQPARSATTLRYSLSRAGVVRLEVYDVTGRRVRVLAEGVRAPGEHAAAWDLRDDAGRAVGAGFYLARLEAEGRVLTERVMALR